MKKKIDTNTMPTHAYTKENMSTIFSNDKKTLLKQ